MVTSPPVPTDAASIASATSDATALFRYGIISSLLGRSFVHGELIAELRSLAARAYRPPQSAIMHRYGVSTIERWYYRYEAEGLAGLRSQPRSDRGRGVALTAEERQLLLDVRREHPRAASAVILRTLQDEGRLQRGRISVTTLNRLYAEQCLRRERGRAEQKAPGQRLRWQAGAPGMIWHSDVCHGPSLRNPEGGLTPIRIHALLDDASRFVVALEVHTREREVEMLGLFHRAIRRHGAPQSLYLDNGSTYRGEDLLQVCAKLKVGLRHAAPYDPEARGKMERFWRTMREQSLDFISPTCSVHDLQVRLLAWLDQQYQVHPHAGLMGKTPERAWDTSANACRRVDETELNAAFMTQVRKRVHNDSTVHIDGEVWEVDARMLCGQIVNVAIPLIPLGAEHRPFIEHDGRVWALHPVDPVANSRRKRERAPEPGAVPTTGFSPPDTALGQATGRLPSATSTVETPE